MKLRFYTIKCYTRISMQVRSAAVIGVMWYACRYLPVFLRCSAVPVMELGENIVSLVVLLRHHYDMSSQTIFTRVQRSLP